MAQTALKDSYSNAFHVFSEPSSSSSSSNPDRAFPILAIAVLSIMGTAFLLVAYYVFVNKCFSNLHQVTLLRWFTIWRATRNDDSFIALSPGMWNRGLDESVIREIPMFQYRRGESEERSIYGCVVCLNEFQEQEMLRVLPNCSHAFHLDCIDIWLQSNANCPLCRTSISGNSRCPVDCIIAPSSSPQGSQPYSESLIGSDEDFVVIELGGEDDQGVLLRQQQREMSSRVAQLRPRCQSPMVKMEEKIGKLKSRKRQHVSIMGDECIDVREKDDQFSVQPIRRSFSLDSVVDRQLYLSVQTIVQQNLHHRQKSTTEETSNTAPKSCFAFGHGCHSRKAVLPVEF